jgi:hypothetical protein
MRLITTFALTSLVAVGCSDAADSEKPASDPDLAVSSAKADRISNYWTDMRGELAIGETIVDAIDYPSYYFGRTAELQAGQRFQIDLVSNRKSLVRLYGPATGIVDGQPVFGSALVRADTRKVSGQQTSSFTFEVPAAGTYLLVYGPQWVWAAEYRIDMTCLEGCAPADACENDWNCEADEFCGDNGVRCVRAPCDANYDVCQDRLGDGAQCVRDGECALGLSCREGTCTGEVCTSSDECVNGFCGCADGSCTSSICKDFAKEGESCGGFRMAHLVSHCSPDFACVAPYDLIADIPGHCGAMTTVAEVLADPRAFEGRFIAVKGVIDPGAPYCTKIACSQENPCCNGCSANLRLFDAVSEIGSSGLYLDEDGAALGCSGGNECTWESTCTLERGNYWVAGWFRLEDGGVTPRLDIVARYAY